MMDLADRADRAVVVESSCRAVTASRVKPGWSLSTRQNLTAWRLRLCKEFELEVYAREAAERKWTARLVLASDDRGVAVYSQRFWEDEALARLEAAEWVATMFNGAVQQVLKALSS